MARGARSERTGATRGDPSRRAPRGSRSPRPPAAAKEEIPGPWVRALTWIAPALLAGATWWLFLSNRAPGTRDALHGFPLDDAWIHLVYARALVTEGGFHYNPGVPEAGMTSPLWVVLIAGPQRALLSAPVGTLVVALKALALLCGIAGAWVLAALARSLGLGARAGLAAAILVALDPALTFSRAAGMEVPLFTLLVLLALLMAVRGRLLATGAATGLAIVARPEGLVLLPVLALMLARGEVLRAPRAGLRLAGALGLALLPALLEVAFCLHAVGTPLPNTFYVKLAGSAADLPRRLALGWSDYVHGDLPYFTLEAGTGLALLGAAMMLRRAPRLAGGVLAAGVLLFAGTLASREFAPGHFHYWERWLLPAVPVLLLAMAVGLTTLAGAAARLLPAGRPAATAIAAAILAAVLLARWPGALVDRAGQYAWNCRNIEELDVAAGRWVDRTLPRDAVVATSDAGAIRYFGRRTTVDLSGLNDHRMRIALAQQEGERQLERAGVGWFTIFPFAYPDLMGRLRLTRVHTLSAAHYTICEAPQDTLAIYRWDRGAR